jgi:hypothetical protein
MYNKKRHIHPKPTLVKILGCILLAIIIGLFVIMSKNGESDNPHRHFVWQISESTE